ncbi:hypothetical protein GGI1_20888 [Acidithiobacillus sp. GGI-221]|nr:hypothetical protein GGI1_20888 [Acidithiobacillus sp. GGI-221]
MQPRYLNESRLAPLIAEFLMMVDYCSTHGGLFIRETDDAWQDASGIMARETGIPVTRVHNDMVAYAAHHYGASWLSGFTASQTQAGNDKWNTRTLANVACEIILRPNHYNKTTRG